MTIGTTGTGNGLIWNPAGGAWSGGAFSISWLITDNGADFTYEYTVNTPTGGSAKLSHWILELSPFDADGNSLKSYWEDVFLTTPSAGNYTGTGVTVINGEVGLAGSQDGNPGMPDVDDGDNSTKAAKDDIWGVRFTRPDNLNVTTTTVTFTTPQVPIWGDFYAKDGGGNGSGAVYAYNIGFGTEPTEATTDFTNWIPRPDGQETGEDAQGSTPGEAPEAGALAIWSLLGLCGLAWVRFGRRRVVS